VSAAGRLRVVGGVLSGRRFARTIARTTRPTSDRVREAIASAIEARGGFEGTRVLDLFAGTGAMAIEALSRGATDATLIESDRGAARAIEESLATLELRDRACVITVEVAKVARSLDGTFDRVFVDPPYAEAEAVPALLDAIVAHLAPEALVVIEHPSKLAITLGARFEALTAKRYGDTSVVIARFT
jgi:16S rRNA (guanine966-N2)-methyltransferase